MSVARCSRSLPRHNTLHSPPPRSTPGRPSSRMARARAGRRRGGGVHTGRTPGSARCARTAWRRPCPRARRCQASPGCRRRGGQNRWIYTSRARSTAPGTRRAACATAMVASIPKSTTQMAAYRFSHSLLWPIRPVLRMMPKSWSHSAPSAMKAHSAKKPCRVP